LLLAKSDSLSLTIFGPFGMTLAKLFAKPDYFLFYNAYNNEAIEGTPSPNNLYKVVYLPFNFYDFLSLTRYENICDAANYEIQTSYKDEKSILFQNKNNNDYIEFYLVSKEDASIKQYQRKHPNGSTILNVFYRNVEENDNFYFPEKIEFNFPSLDVGLIIECNSLKFNESYDKPFSINLPNNTNIKKIEE
jgi:hypothetical protein